MTTSPEAEQAVASVLERERNITISNSPLKIIALNDRKCCLYVLLNTGSPVSFIRADVFQKFFAQDINPSRTATRKFTALNNLPLLTCGSLAVKSKISFEQ